MNKKFNFFNYDVRVVPSKPFESQKEFDIHIQFIRTRKRLLFEKELQQTKSEEIVNLIKFHLKYYLRHGGLESDFMDELWIVNRTKLNPKQEDVLLSYIEEFHRPPYEKVFEKDNPLKNYNMMVRMYNGFFVEGKYNFDQIYEKCRLYEYQGLRDFAHRAVHEIELQFLNHFNNFELLRKKVLYEYEELSKINDEIIKKNNLNHVSILPKYTIYFETVQPLHNFFDACRFYLERIKDNSEIQVKQDQIENKSFKIDEIFVNKDSQKYIDALKNTIPPLIDSNQKFIGKPMKHKGVICSWFKQLQTEGILSQSINRSQMAELLNNAFENLNLGKGGKTFDNYSKEYALNFKEQLINLTKQ